MKKTLISLTALILMFVVASAYACGNHDKVDMSSAKAKAAGVNSHTNAADKQAGGDACVSSAKEARVMTTEAHDGKYGDKASKTTGGSCETPTKTTAKKSPVKADKVAETGSQTKGKSLPSSLIGAPVDLTTVNQK